MLIVYLAIILRDSPSIDSISISGPVKRDSSSTSCLLQNAALDGGARARVVARINAHVSQMRRDGVLTQHAFPSPSRTQVIDFPQTSLARFSTAWKVAGGAILSRQ